MLGSTVGGTFFFLINDDDWQSCSGFALCLTTDLIGSTTLLMCLWHMVVVYAQALLSLDSFLPT